MTISTVAGDGSGAFGGDGGLATLANLHDPESVSVMPDGGYLVADVTNNRIRRVAPDGTITTVAGTGSAGYNGEGLATAAHLNQPEGVAALPDGGFLIADTVNSRIRHVSPLGTIETVAGTGSCNLSGDGGLALTAAVCNPRAVAPLGDGGYLIADTGNHVVRRVSSLGMISRVAGNGQDGDDGDGGAATNARLGAPDDVAPVVNGAFLVADGTKDVVRMVSPNGTITTVAGDSSGPGSGDLAEPADVEPLNGGGFLIADHDTGRVLRVDPDGTVRDFAGTGTPGFGGDGGPATAAELAGPHGLAITADGDLLIADGHNHRVRRVDADFVPGVPGVEPPRQDDSPSDSRLEPASEPVLGASVVATPGFGMVKVKLPGGDRWVLLEEDSSIPVGSFVNTLNGSVVLTSALEDGSQTGTFWDGIFQVRQARGGNGMTNLVLRGGNLGRCRTARGGRPGALSSARRRPSRRLWAKDDNGRFRTHGRDSVATTRGTLWLTADRCKGTVTRVREGYVRVRHRHGRRSVLVGAGERYLARHR